MSKRFSRSSALAVMLMLSSGLMAGDAKTPEKTFEINFTKGLTAEFAKGNPAPLKSGDVEFVEGVNGGKAVHIPKTGGYLLYSLAGNFPKERGTILLWLKPAWSPKGVKTWRNDFRGIFCTAKNGVAPGPATVSSNGNQLGAVQDGVLHYHWYGKSKELPCWYQGQEDFSANVWKCYAFTWDKEKGIAFFLDGRPMLSSLRLDRSLGDADSFYLGSAFFSGKQLGFEGSLAKAVIYDGALTESQITAESWANLPGKTSVELMNCAALADTKNDIRFKCSNLSGKEVSEKLRFVVKAADGEELGSFSRNLSLGVGEETIESLELIPPVEGKYAVNVFSGEALVGSFEFLAISPIPLSASMPLSKDGATKDLLLETIDCAKELGPDKYRDDGQCRVVKSKLGEWREAFGDKHLSGFIYQLAPLKRPGKPHWLEIEYPDNAPRQFYVAVFQEKDGKTLNAGTLDTIGVLTGGLHPLTNTMQKKRLLFWPDTKDLVVGCYLYAPHAGERSPALAKISLYEIEGPLPQLEIPASNVKPRRMIGVWQEDPAMPRDIWFNRVDVNNGNPLSFWLEKWSRMANYLRYSGQNLCDMEVVNYFGAPSKLIGYTYGWDDLGALLLQREGLGFLLQMHDIGICSHIKDFGGLARTIGVEKISWSLEEAIAKGDASLERFSNDDVWSATGKTETSHGYPLLNPLHPQVQAGYLKLIRDYARRFEPYDSFKGISFLAVNWSSLFYRDITEGYEDWSVARFEADTGVKIPVSASDRHRFSKRYAWLMDNAKDKWLQWRADRLARFYAEMARTLRQIAPGRQIVILHYDSGSDYATWPQVPSLRATWLERGVDFSQLAAIEGFKFTPPSMKPNYERAGQNGPDRQKGELKNLRYYCFSPELAELQAQAPTHATALIHHSNFETYGNYAPEQVKSYFLPRAVFEAGGSTCHVSYATPHPDNKYELEHLTRLLADFNPEIMLNGWWGSPDNGAIDVYQPFYRAFRSIPLIGFEKVPGAGDPVQVKYGVDHKSRLLVFPDNDYYVTLVNRECYPVQVELSLETDATELRDVIEDAPVKLFDGKLRLSVKPYQVLCFQSASALVFKNVEMRTPPEIVDDLTRKLSLLEGALAAMPQDKRQGCGLDKIVELAKVSLSAKEYSRLHYLFQSALAQKHLAGTTPQAKNGQ